MMKAVIQGQANTTLKVSQLKPGTLFKVNPQISTRLFVKAGSGLGPNGNPLKGANSSQPPVYALVVPTVDRFDQRAYTPATSSSYRRNGTKRSGIDGNTAVWQTFGTLVVTDQN